MLITPHLLTGAAIGATNLSPAISFTLAFLSHFVLDAIPHLESTTFYKDKRKKIDEPVREEYYYAAVDAVIGIAIIFLIYFYFQNPLVLWGAFFGILPDIIDNVPLWYGIRKFPVFHQLHQLHDFIHFDLKKKYWVWGLISQLIIIAAALFFCYN